MDDSIYAPPEVIETHGENAGNAFSDQGRLVICKGFESPFVCLKTGEKEEVFPKEFTKWIVYTPRWFMMLWGVALLLAVLSEFMVLLPLVFWVGLVVLAILQKKVKLKFYLSVSKAKVYKRNRLLVLLFLLAAILSGVLALFIGSEVFIFVTVILVLSSVLVSIFTNRLVKLVRYKKGKFWLNGVSDDYLALFPLLYFESSDETSKLIAPDQE